MLSSAELTLRDENIVLHKETTLQPATAKALGSDHLLEVLHTAA